MLPGMSVSLERSVCHQPGRWGRDASGDIGAKWQWAHQVDDTTRSPPSVSKDGKGRTDRGSTTEDAERVFGAAGAMVGATDNHTAALSTAANGIFLFFISSF